MCIVVLITLEIPAPRIRDAHRQSAEHSRFGDACKGLKQSMNNETLLVVFVALTAVAVLLQGIVLLALFFALRKTAHSMKEEISDLHRTITPMVTDARDFLTRVGPKIDAITTDLAGLSQGLRTQGEELHVSANEILERVRRQSGRLDLMFTSMLDNLERASSVVVTAVNTPLRQISAVAAFAKAAIGTLRAGPAQNGPQPTHSPADKDLFV